MPDLFFKGFDKGQIKLGPKLILVFAPHFDDEVLACGATIVKMIEKGWDVAVCGLTCNEEAYSMPPSDGYPIDRQMQAFYKEHEKKILDQWTKSMQILGYKSWYRMYGFSDMFLPENGPLIKLMIAVIRECRPQIVITTHYNDFHTDHRASAVAAREAVYQAPRRGICGSIDSFKEPLLLFGEVDMEKITNMKCDVYSEVTLKQLEKKFEALKCYEGFVDEHPSQGSIFDANHGCDWIWSLARLRGMHAGVKHAEVFEVGNLKTMFSIDKIEGVFK